MLEIWILQLQTNLCTSSILKGRKDSGGGKVKEHERSYILERENRSVFRRNRIHDCPVIGPQRTEIQSTNQTLMKVHNLQKCRQSSNQTSTQNLYQTLWLHHRKYKLTFRADLSKSEEHQITWRTMCSIKDRAYKYPRLFCIVQYSFLSCVHPAQLKIKGMFTNITLYGQWLF